MSQNSQKSLRPIAILFGILILSVVFGYQNCGKDPLKGAFQNKNFDVDDDANPDFMAMLDKAPLISGRTLPTVGGSGGSSGGIGGLAADFFGNLDGASEPRMKFQGSNLVAESDFSGIIYGWALNNANKQETVIVRVFVDGQPGSNFGLRSFKRANDMRGDVDRVFPGSGTYHGYSFRFPKNMALGSHRILVAGYDRSNGVWVPIAGGTNDISITVTGTNPSAFCGEYISASGNFHPTDGDMQAMGLRIADKPCIPLVASDGTARYPDSNGFEIFTEQVRNNWSSGTSAYCNDHRGGTYVRNASRPAPQAPSYMKLWVKLRNGESLGDPIITTDSRTTCP